MVSCSSGSAIPSAWEVGRYRLLAKPLLDVPGKGKHPGRLKNYLTDKVCGSGDVLIVVPKYASVWGRTWRNTRSTRSLSCWIPLPAAEARNRSILLVCEPREGFPHLDSSGDVNLALGVGQVAVVPPVIDS